MNNINDLLQELYVPEHLPVSVTPYIDEYLKSLGDGSRKYEGLETGLTQIDKLLGGLSRFVLMAGMGGVGKSTLALQMALGVAECEQIPVIYFSFEMSRHDVLTMAIQNLSRKVLRNDIELRGNAPELRESDRMEIATSAEKLRQISERLYIFDTSAGTFTLDDIQGKIELIKQQHGVDRTFVVLDSVQDVVPSEMNQVQAEARACQRIVEIQQATNSTILAIAQKNKSGVREGGGYSSVMGSVAFIHKPTTVIELIGGKEAIAKLKEGNSSNTQDITRMEKALLENTKNTNVAYPVYMNVIKGRNTGYGGIGLKYFGAFRYYEVGQERDFTELYSSASKVFSGA